MKNSFPVSDSSEMPMETPGRSDTQVRSTAVSLAGAGNTQYRNWDMKIQIFKMKFTMAFSRLYEAQMKSGRVTTDS